MSKFWVYPIELMEQPSPDMVPVVLSPPEGSPSYDDLYEAFEECVMQGCLPTRTGGINHGGLSTYEWAFKLLIASGGWEEEVPGWSIRRVGGEPCSSL